MVVEGSNSENAHNIEASKGSIFGLIEFNPGKGKK